MGGGERRKEWRREGRRGEDRGGVIHTVQGT